MAFRPFSDIGNFKLIITAKAVYAPVAEQADAPDSGSGRGDSVQVRFLSGAPKIGKTQTGFADFYFFTLHFSLKSDSHLSREGGGFLFYQTDVPVHATAIITEKNAIIKE